jgi:hypothetical protein
METLTDRPYGQLIYLIRGHKVMLSTDLARLYEVPAGALIQAVKRNKDRFPEDFMFKLSPEETENWKSQFVISNLSFKMGLRKSPYAFTEQGVAMLSSVLKSPRAIRINIAIMRVFVKIRQTLALHKELSGKLDSLERRIAGHDADIRTIFQAISELGKIDDKPRRGIGFKPEGRR